MQNRLVSILIAALLPLLLFGWFIPKPIGQIDFWIMWFIAMLIVGLPLLYAEIGLANRSQLTPMDGIQELTRQADSSTVWRSFVWLTVLLAMVVAALSIDAVSNNLISTLDGVGIQIDIPDFALALMMVVIAGILSLLGSTTVIAAVFLLLTALIMGALPNLSQLSLTVTEASIGEWARAVVLALVSVGAGTGLYWFNTQNVQIKSHDANNHTSNNTIASRTVLPIWLTQLVTGSAVLLLTNKELPVIAIAVYSLGVIAAAAYLMYYASSQLSSKLGRFGIWIASVVVIVIIGLLVIMTAPVILSMVVIVVSILSAMVLAIFSGWQMKISHMRKSLNFSSEAIYNLWRVVIRIIAPIAIIAAIIGWLM